MYIGEKNSKFKLNVSHRVLLLIACCLFVCQDVGAFTPSKNLELLTEIVDYELDEKAISTTLTHMDIFRRGLVRSLAKYFADKQKQRADFATLRRFVNMSKVDSIYVENLHELYMDYLSEREYMLINTCKLEIENVIQMMSDSVASVDFDETLKDLPWAHFDANTFVQANRHVRSLTKSLLKDIFMSKNLPSARKKIGLVLHTIHDFYSHSNWVEMGHSDRINEKIGSSKDDDLGAPIINDQDRPCIEQNCTKKILKCKYLKSLTTLIKYLNVKLPLTDCPIVYYICNNNVITHKLTSGYYTGQKLPDGSSISKPVNGSKCSHGGAFDASSQLPATGGINKDTGYYFLSPRADLHLKAAQLAIKHTEYFFDNLRDQIGDANFDELLQLLHSDNTSVFCFFKKIFS